MNWSYSGDPSSSTRDKVRFLIGDTDSTDQQFSDAEIDAMLADNSDAPYTTAIAMTEALIGKFSRLPDRTIGDLSISYGGMVENYRNLLKQLRLRGTIQGAAPYAGGISISDKQSQEADSDRVAPAFSVGMHDYEEPSAE